MTDTTQMTPYEKIFLMNSIIGNKEPVVDTEEFWTQVRNQTERVVEEASETLDEAIEQNLEKLIGEVTDIMVVSIGLYQKLQLAGIDIDAALNRVCDKNLEKFFTDPEAANETVQYYTEKGVDTFVRHVTLNNGDEYYAVIRKADGKLLKPKGFESASYEDIAQEAIENVGNEEQDTSA